MDCSTLVNNDLSLAIPTIADEILFDAERISCGILAVVAFKK